VQLANKNSPPYSSCLTIRRLAHKFGVAGIAACHANVTSGAVMLKIRKSCGGAPQCCRIRHFRW
jgi:hypothetical protein